MAFTSKWFSFVVLSLHLFVNGSECANISYVLGVVDPEAVFQGDIKISCSVGFGTASVCTCIALVLHCCSPCVEAHMDLYVTNLMFLVTLMVAQVYFAVHNFIVYTKDGCIQGLSLMHALALSAHIWNLLTVVVRNYMVCGYLYRCSFKKAIVLIFSIGFGAPFIIVLLVILWYEGHYLQATRVEQGIIGVCQMGNRAHPGFAYPTSLTVFLMSWYVQPDLPFHNLRYMTLEQRRHLVSLRQDIIASGVLHVFLWLTYMFAVVNFDAPEIELYVTPPLNVLTGLLLVSILHGWHRKYWCHCECVALPSSDGSGLQGPNVVSLLPSAPPVTQPPSPSRTPSPLMLKSALSTPALSPSPGLSSSVSPPPSASSEAPRPQQSAPERSQTQSAGSADSSSNH